MPYNTTGSSPTISPALKVVVIGQAGIIVLLLSLFIYFTLNGVPSSPSTVTTYQECLDSFGSSLQESYPATCVTKNQERFVQPLTSEEEQTLRPETIYP